MVRVTDLHASFDRIIGAGVPPSSMSPYVPRADGAPEDLAGRSSGAIYLGLDQDSEKLPWARGHGRMERPETGTFGLPPWLAPNGSLNIGVLGKRVEDFIRDQVATGVTNVISEKPYIGPNGVVVEKLFTIRAAVAIACEKAGVRLWREVPVAKWRMHFIGVDRAPNYIAADAERRAWLKAQAIETCKRRDWAVASEDEAEAAGVLNWALCQDYPAYAQSWLPMFYTRRHS